MAARFTFVFVAMGQGDCCLVRCPDGRVVVVDCGSTANPYGDPDWVNEAQILLRANTFAGGNGNSIDALILTHSDDDHHNKVVQFFKATSWTGNVNMPTSGQVLTNPSIPQVNIDTIYFSDAYADNSPLAYYSGGALNGHIYNHYFSTEDLYEVTINNVTDANNSFKRWNWTRDHFAALVPPAQANAHQINGKRLTILNGTTNGMNWSVSIIAGNVPRGYGNAIDGATADNAKSLITLFEVNGRKALLCGDATFSTEQFLTTVHGGGGGTGILQNIDLIQVPHHGSAYASGANFVQLTNPRWAVASVGFLEHTYRMPRYDAVLEEWMGTLETHGNTITHHDVDYWTMYTDASPPQQVTTNDIDNKYNTWTTNGTDFSLVGYNQSRKFFYLQTPPYGVYGYYRKQTGGQFLFRESVDSTLTLTSQKTQRFYLSDTGVTYIG